MPEADMLWDLNWHLLCHRRELEVPDSFLRFDIGNREVVVFNDGTSPVAFDNRCPHRGARIFDDSHGAQRFLCRYHGWSYRNGRLLVGRKDAFAACSIEEADLAKLQIEWVGDFLFVGSTPRRTLTDQLQGLSDILNSISTDVDRRVDYNGYQYECDWRVAVENALEPYHVALVHPDTLGTLRLSAGRNDYLGSNSVWYSEVGDSRTAKRLERLGQLFELSWQFKGYVSLFLFPYTMLSSTYGYSYSLQHFLPGKGECTNFISRLYSSKLAAGVKPELLASFFESTAKLNRETFIEDHEICKRVPLSSWSPGPPQFWSEAEEKILHFRQSYRENINVGADLPHG